MAYSDFTIKQLIAKFGLIQEKTDLFGPELPMLESSNWLKQSLELGLNLPLNSEKAKSETLIAPILYEIKRRNLETFTIYSGMNLIADSDKGLVGECDFVLAKEDHKYLVSTGSQRI